MTKADELKIILREKDIPFFSDEEIEYYLGKYSFNEAAYMLLMIKAENTKTVISALEVGDSSAYFRRLASRYRTNNSRVLRSN